MAILVNTFIGVGSLLGANATFTQSNFDTPTLNDLNAISTWIVATSSSDQAGTLFVDQSADGAVVERSDKLATSADAASNQSAMLKVQVVFPFVRVRYTNGATAQAIFFVLASRYTQS
jgi:hypothetical protein